MTDILFSLYIFIERDSCGTSTFTGNRLGSCS